MKTTKAEQEEAIKDLREMVPPGSTVYTVLRHCSRSGMCRDIDCYIMQDNQPRWISRLVSKATGFGFNEKKDAIRVGGCGMDMGFHIVYSLSRVLWRDNFTCIGKNCRSNDHTNGDKNYAPHQHSDGGYALNHRWM